MPGRQITLLVGPPGSGKTTLGPLLADMFERPHLELSVLIEKEIATGSESGRYLKLCQKQNRTPDDVTLLNLFRDEILNNCPLGCFLSDFPQTLSQAQAFDRFLISSGDRSKLKVIELYTSDEVAEERLRSRVVHASSGRVYNTVFYPPKADGVDDETGEALVRLERDHELLVPKELYKYHLGCEPQLNHFGRFNRIFCPAEKKVKELVVEPVSLLRFVIVFVFV
eukprot:g11284.t1